MAGRRHGVRELLEVFGAVDVAIKASDRKEFGTAVDRFLPRYSSHCGWYQELEQFMFSNDALTNPTLEHALEQIAVNDSKGRRLKQPEKARLLLGLATIARLNRLGSDCPLPNLATDLRDHTIEALAAVGPSGAERGPRLDKANNWFEEFTTAVPESFESRDLFDDLRMTALGQGIVGRETAWAPMCKTAVIRVDGFDSVLVDTIVTSDEVSLDNLKRVVNPYNWNANYPDFFLSMTNDGEAYSPDGWRRVLETVELLIGFGLRTPLKYFPSAPGPNSAMLDYDLDHSRFEIGDGKVRVDRGYINMTSTGNPAENGVRVQTRKVVHIKGLSPFAQERLVCVAGYGTASADFLFGCATSPSETAEGFDFPTSNEAADQALIDDTPIPPARHAVPLAVQMWTDTLVDVTGHYADLAEKWWGGSLSASDVADFGSRLGSRLAATPLAYLDAVTRSRHRSE